MKYIIRPNIKAIAFAATAFVATSYAARAQTVVIHAGAVLDPRSGRTERNVTLIIRDGVIAARGRSIVTPAGASVLELPDATLLPGLIDTHVHLTLAGRPRDNARKTLEAGFTTVADLGSANGSGARLRDLINRDSTAGPRVIAAGSWIGGKGGVCEFGGATIRGAEEARVRAEKDVAAGAQILKLCITDWLDPVVLHPDSVEMTTAEIDAVVSVGKRARIPVVAHAIGSAGAAAALKAGVTWLAHTPVVDELGAKAIAKANVCVSSTMTTLLQGQSAAAIRASFANLRKAHVRLAAGTDAGVLAHGNNADELVTLTGIGLSPLEAIQAATTVAADCLGMAGYGSLQPGSVADIVAVNGDPLKDIRFLKEPVLVMKRGLVVRSNPSRSP